MGDPLRPDVEAALAAWRDRVAADHEQVERCREVADPADFYAPVVRRFRADPRRTGDDVLTVLLGLARPTDVWLDVGAGGGRYALPLALRVREVVAVEPSSSMVGALREGMAEAGVSNVRVVNERWPLASAAAPGAAPTADVGLMAHIGYDIDEIGPFIDALEGACSRLCVAVMGQSAMTTVATLFWHDVHGERRIRLPAMPELLALLLARGRLPSVVWAERAIPWYDSVEDALAMARRQLWVAEGSAKDARLAELARSRLIERDGRYTFDELPSKIGIAAWEPR